MDYTRLCRGCFHVLPQPGMTCPHCGFNQAEYEKNRERESLPTDTILRGAYILGKSLGRGGFGITYIGWHINLEKVVAIKEFFPRGFVSRNTTVGFSDGSSSVHLVDSSLQASYRTSLQGFLKEAKTLGRIQLPGVVTVHDCFEENGTAYIVMDYVNGHNLKIYMQENGGKVSEAETLRLLHPVITSLQQLHKKGVIHRDISPDNILVNQTGESILVDFGAARNLELVNGTEYSLTVILKPGFAPIEQYDSHGSQGPWTDVYALCATMYKMMTGITPAEPVLRLDKPENRQELLANLKRNGISDKTSSVLLKGMEVFPRNRFQSMSEFETALYGSGKVPEKRGAQSEKNETGGKDHAESVLPQQPPKRPMTGIIILAAALVLAAAVGAFFYYQSNGLNFRSDEIPVLKKGTEINKMLKEIAGMSKNSEDDNTNIRSVAFTESSAPKDARTANLAKIGYDPVIAWFDEQSGTINLQTENDKIKLNKDSSKMFSDCSGLTTLDLSRFDTSAVTDMSWMFSHCSGLTTLDLSRFDTSAVTDMSWMFNDCAGLTALDLSNFDTSAVTNMGFMFMDCSSLTALDLSSFNTSAVTEMYYMFEDCSGLTALDLSNFDTSAVTEMYYMFNGCSGLTALDLSNFDTSAVTEMYYMFNGCSGLTALDLRSFDTSAVTTMLRMFEGCSGLTALDLSNFDTSAVTEMDSMFKDCSGLTALDLRSFDTSAVTNMWCMFNGCSGLTALDLSNFDTSAVTEMNSMFEDCSGLTALDLSGFDSSSVTSMSDMFSGCSGLTALDLSGFDSSSVTNVSGMFSGCSGLTYLDLSGFDTASVKHMYGIFKDCDKLTELITQDARLRSEYENK